MDKLAEKMAELAEKFGPTVVDAALGAVRIEAYSSMMSGALAVLAGIVGLFAARFCWRYECKGYDDGIQRFLGGILAAGSMIPICMGIWSFIDPWVWTAISHPDLYLAKKIFKL